MIFVAFINGVISIRGRDLGRGREEATVGIPSTRYRSVDPGSEFSGRLSQTSPPFASLHSPPLLLNQRLQSDVSKDLSLIVVEVEMVTVFDM